MKIYQLLFLFLLALLSAPTSAQTSDVQWGDSWGDEWDEEEATRWPIFGFVELASSQFIFDGNLNSEPLNEVRWRLEWSDTFSSIKLNTKADVFYDSVIEPSNQKFSGEMREANFEFSPLASVDMKVGRQILTWGTGDLLFINDLFPKDWQSFFSGRDDEYLKAPSDAIKISWFNKRLNLDVVVTPQFDPDTYINGERFSFWANTQAIQQPLEPITAVEPNSSEVALRVFKTQSGIEWAAYGYKGFYKSPNTINEVGQFTFSKLEVLGASIRGNLLGGIGNLEVGRYNSVDDPNGDNPFIDNDQLRVLVGYEREIIKNLTGSLQYYVEITSDYQTLLANSFNLTEERARIYRLASLRLTHSALQQNLTNSLFLFYSPTEKDSHLRLKSDYRINDQWTISSGVYWFDGKQPQTFWSQFQDNRSAWLRVRFNY